MKPCFPALTPNERKGRLFVLTVSPCVLLLLRSVQPDGLPAWLPFPTSCGAITGLPCIFCGMTRALHFLLNGDFRRALYFNWLAFPLAVGAGLLLVLMIVELLFDRNIIARSPKVHFNGASISGVFVGLLLLWCLQMYLAVSQHKHELLNPVGPLYSLIVH